MQTLQGIAVSPGVAIGEALVIDDEGFRIPRRIVARNAVEQELQRWQRSSDAVAKEIEQSRDRVADRLGDRYGAIISAQLQMLCAPHLVAYLKEEYRRAALSLIPKPAET